MVVKVIYKTHYLDHVIASDGFELALEERYRRTLLEIDSLKEDLGK